MSEVEAGVLSKMEGALTEAPRKNFELTAKKNPFLPRTALGQSVLLRGLGIGGGGLL